MKDTSHPRSASSGDSDEALLLRALQSPEGDLRAFEELALRYQKRVVANCRCITRDPNNAEDLAQEVLVKAFFGLRGLERKSSFGTSSLRTLICWNKRVSKKEYMSWEVAGF